MLVTHPISILGLAIVTAATMLPMRIPAIETSAALLPPLRILVAYGVFFAFGWRLYAERAALPKFGTRAVVFTVAGLVATLVYLVVLQQAPRMTPRAYHAASVACGGLAVWLLIFALLGIFVRWLEAQRPRVRYLSDASYWIYLTHLLPIMWTVGALARLSWPAGVKFAIVLTVTTALTVITYHCFVRSTVVGQMLNGRRYQRSSRTADTLPSSV